MNGLSEADFTRVVLTWNAAANEDSAEATVPERFAACVARSPESIAVISEHEQLSYRELDLRSNRIARRLQALGVVPDTRVALYLERSPDLIVALLGILKAGGAYLPIEPSYGEGRIRFLLQDAGAGLLVTRTALLADLPPFEGTVLDTAASDLAAESDAQVTSGVTVEHLAYVLYTSGSTGKPKGVAVPHRAIDRLVHQPGFAKLDSSVTILQAAPVAFDASTFEIWGALANGGRIAIHPERVPTARGLRQSIERFGATTMWLTAALFNTVVDEDERALGGLSELLTGGETLSVPHIRRALRSLPNTQLINGYGPTETTTFATCYRIPRELPEGLSAIPIGKAIRRTRLYVLDEQRNPVAPGTVGELYVGGRGVARGYLGNEELTRERFVQDPFRPGELVYRTGDLVRFLEDGTVDYVGRSDQQVKIRGFRIELGEIETALSALPWWQHGVVVARGEGAAKRLVAYAVLAAGHSAPKPSEIRAQLEKALPEYMVPATFVWLPAIPVTANGKVDYRALPEPSHERPELDVEYRPARTDLQHKLVDTFSRLLGLDRIGVLDNLFDLGATSLLVVRAVAQLREQHGLDVPVVRIFQYPTAESLAGYLERPQAGRGAATPKRALRAHGGVAIIGMAGRFPGADSVAALWQNLCDSVDSTSFFSESELDPDVPAELARDPRYVRARGVLENVDQFEPAFFGITPKEAALMDPQQRVLFEVSWEALESAGYVPEKVNGAIGVFAGKYNDTYYSENVVTRPDLIAELGAFQVMIANEKDYVATRLAHRLDLKGPALSIHTACSTSLVTIAQAVQSLQLGQCEMALAGGASITVPVKSGYLYQEGAMLSSDGRTRSFDAKANGTVFSDGVAMVVLKRLDDALRDRDLIYGVIRGAAVNNDGGGKSSFTAPSIDGQADVIIRAHADAGIEPHQVSYVETHGTATPLGDPIEVEALNLAFSRGSQTPTSCGIGSVKSNVGHLVIAAGATGVIKTALALTHELIPATAHFESPNPKIDFAAGPFHVVAKATPWPAGGKPRIAGVSSFGVGGTNAHVVIEEAPKVVRSPSERSGELLLLSARSESALANGARLLAEHFEGKQPANLADAAFTLHAGRREFAFRRAVVAKDSTSAALALRAGANKAPSKAELAPQFTFVFPGQGSQHTGMAAELYREYPAFRATVDYCLAQLGEETSTALRRLVFTHDTSADGEAELSQTSLAQPALFIVEYALAKQWQDFGVQPAALLGHSVGEFVCAVLASVMPLDGALRLVAERGRRMQEQPRGSMLSVRLPAAELEQRLSGGLALASDNAPSLCVVAGPSAEVEELARQLEAEGAACRPLRTSHAFHSPMMNPVVEPFLALLREVPLGPPRVPIASTVTGQWLTDNEATDPTYWAKQLRLPVRFRTALATAARTSKTMVLEVGPRQTLATLGRQQLGERARGRVFSTLGDRAEGNADALRRALGELWCVGATLDPSAVHGTERGRVALPTYAFDRKRYWVERARGSAPTIAATPANQPIPAVAVEPPPRFEAAVTPSEPQPNVPDGPKLNAMTNTHRTQLVSSLCEALEETSGLEIAAADAEVPFVELGLDSLFLTQFALTVQRKFSVKISFRELQEEYSTMDSLAERIETLRPDLAAAAAATPAAPAAAAAPPSPASVASPSPLPVQATFAPATFVATAGSNVNPAIKALIDAQLQIMAQQLSLLAGIAPVQMALPAQVAAPQPAAPAPQAVAAPQPAAAAPQAVAAPPKADGDEAEATGMAKYDVKKAFGAIARIHTSKTEELTPKQKAKLEAFTRRYNARTKSSKQFTQDNRAQMADPRSVTGFKPAVKELVYPIVVDRSAGSKLWDLDGNEYVDALNGFGLNLFGWQPDFVTRAIEAQLHRGHEIGPQHPLQAEVAKLFCEFTKFDRAAFCNTGSEAVMGCMRIARTVTGKNTIAIMTGSYHGIFDEVVVRGTKKLRSIPAAPGIMPSTSQNVLVLDYGTPETLEILKSHADDLAAIMVEPIQSRRPDFRPREFLTEVRELTEKAGIVYIFDEVVTGFRLGQGGAQEYFGFQADLASYGKVVGGGLPIGVIAGKSRFMDALDGGFWEFGDASTPPVGVTYFAGTFVRHPLALAAAKAVLTHLKAEGPELQRKLNERTLKFVDELNAFVKSVEAPIELKSVASLWRTTYTTDQQYGDLLFYMMRDRGVHIWDGFPCFFTTAHSEADFAHIAKAFKDSVLELQEAGFLPERQNKRPVTMALDPNVPPAPGARLGRDPSGNPAWFVPNPTSPGQYVQLENN
jgi:amino acid adenylation domain-containing protein